MRRWIPKLLKLLLRQAGFYWGPVFWANWGPISQLLGNLIQLPLPPVLVLSIPRSGSSWVGSALGFSNNALYLREPVTQTYLTYNRPGVPVLFEILANQLPPAYEMAANAAFAGIPVFSRTIVEFPQQWTLHNRMHKQLVIKEVNLLALSWIVNRYNPLIIYLIRHPAAVASSIYQLGWTNNQRFEKKFSAKTLESMQIDYKKFNGSFWTEFGALQAVIQSQTLEILKQHAQYEIVKYEDLCANPLSLFRKLYDFASLQWSVDVEKQIIASSTFHSLSGTGQYGIYRNSQTMADKWKFELLESAINELKVSYLHFNPLYYGIEEW